MPILSLKFQHTAARRRLLKSWKHCTRQPLFQHTAARRRLLKLNGPLNGGLMFQHTAARRRLQQHFPRDYQKILVSTHSRPKAAANPLALFPNKQRSFQHTAARRRLLSFVVVILMLLMFQHTAARRRLQYKNYGDNLASLFQHTAARRRLPESELLAIQQQAVSTHSRPKAAASACPAAQSEEKCFNTQPPEGGCVSVVSFSEALISVSTHSRPKAAAPYIKKQEKSAY